MLDLFQAPIRVHLRPFAVKNRLPGPPEPPERPKWTANERKFTQMGRPDPFLARFHAFRGPLPRFQPSADRFRLSDLGPPTFRPRPPLQPSCDSFSALEPPFAAVFGSKRPLRGTICEIGVTWRLKTGIKPTSRGFSTGLAAPYSHNPQPLAPLTRPRLFAILLPLRKNHPAA